MPPKCMSHSYTPVMTKYDMLDKLPDIGEVRPYSCKSCIDKTVQRKMPTDVISRHTEEEDKDEYNSTYRNPL